MQSGGQSVHASRIARAAFVGVAVMIALAAGLAPQTALTAGRLPQYGGASSAQAGGVDTALIVSVDVSSSVDERRYQIQLEGIAAALEDQGVIDAILSGPSKSILFAIVTWADRPKLSLPWLKIASREDAIMTALKVRTMQREGGDFTCLSKMLRFISDKIIPQIPERAAKVVVDVSGDGSDTTPSTAPS